MINQLKNVPQPFFHPTYPEYEHLEFQVINKCIFPFQSGQQNLLLNSLLNAGIIDENYRLIKNIDLPPLPKLSDEQIKRIKEFFASMPSVGIGENTISFSIQDLMKRLYNKHGQDFTSIDIVGGFLRFLIRTSKDYCVNVLKLLGLKNPESLFDESFFTYPGPLNDIDIRFRSPQKEWYELDIRAEEIINLLTENSKIEKTIIKDCAFKKFCPVSLPRNTRKTHTVFKVASLGQMIIQNISRTPIALECLFIKKLKRESLFIQDALKIDIKKFIENLEAELTFESDFHKGWQSIIDILTQVIHLNDPSSVDFAGFLMLVSYFSRWYILGDGKIDERDVLFILRETFFFLDPFQKKTLFEQTLERLNKCLFNHHKEDLTSTVTFLFNFFSCLDGEKFVDFSELWKAKCKSLKSEDSLASKINEAFCQHNLSFNIVKAIVCLAGFCALGNPFAILKKHREQPHIQIKLQEHNSSCLLIPFFPKEGLQEFQKWKNNNRSEKSQKILISLFEEISKNHSPSGIEVFEIPEIPLPTRKEMLSPLGHIINTLILSTGKWRMRKEELFYLFPFAISNKSTKKEKILQRLIQETEQTPYKFIIPKLEKIPIPDAFNAKEFVRSWISQLAESQDKKLCEIVKKLYFDFDVIYSQKDTEDLIQTLLPSGLNESLKEICLIYDNFLRKNSSSKKQNKNFEKASLLFIKALIKVKYEYNAEVFLEKLIKGNFVFASNSKTSTLWLKLGHIQEKNGFHLRAYELYKNGKKLQLWPTGLKTSKSFLNFTFEVVKNLGLTNQPKAIRIFDTIINSLKINETTRDRIGLLVKKNIEFLFSISKNDILSHKITKEYKIHLNNLNYKYQQYNQLSLSSKIRSEYQKKYLHLFKEILLKLAEKSPLVYLSFCIARMVTQKYLSENHQIIELHASFFEKIKDFKIVSPLGYQALDEKFLLEALIKLLEHRMEYAKFFSENDRNDYYRHICLVIERTKYLLDKNFPEKINFFNSIYILLQNAALNMTENQIYCALKEYFMKNILNKL